MTARNFGKLQVPIVAAGSLWLLAFACLTFPVALLFLGGAAFALATLLEGSYATSFLIPLGFTIGCAPVGTLFFAISVLCWIDYFRKKPLLVIKNDRLFDYRQSPKPLVFSDVTKAKLSRNRTGRPMGVVFWPSAYSGAWTNRFRLGCGSLPLRDREKRVCVSIACLDKSASTLVGEIEKRLREAGVTVSLT